MNSAYYRSRKDPGKLSAVDAGDAEDLVRQIRLAGGLAQFICPSCGMPAIYVGPQNGNRARGSVSAYFRHIDQKRCEIPDCDLRVDLGMSCSAPLSQKLRLPLFLRPAAGGGFCLSAGFRTANKEALRLLRSQGYRRAVLKNSAKTLAKADLEEMERTDSIYFVDLTEPVSAKEQYAVTLEGNDMTAPGSANPDWNNMLDGFGHASVGALFEYGAGGAGEKVPFGGFASADRPYLLAVKDSGSSSIKSFWQDCAETQLIPCKMSGGLSFPGNHTANYRVYQVTFPNSKAVSEVLYMKIAEKLRDQCSVTLCDSVPELLPVWPPASRKSDSFAVQDTGTRTMFAAVNEAGMGSRVFVHAAEDTVREIPVTEYRGTPMVEIPLTVRRMPVSFSGTLHAGVARYRLEKLETPAKHEILIMLDDETSILDPGSYHIPSPLPQTIRLRGNASFTILRSRQAPMTCEPGKEYQIRPAAGETIAAITDLGMTYLLDIEGRESTYCRRQRVDLYDKYQNKTLKGRLTYG